MAFFFSFFHLKRNWLTHFNFVYFIICTRPVLWNKSRWFSMNHSQQFIVYNFIKPFFSSLNNISIFVYLLTLLQMVGNISYKIEFNIIIVWVSKRGVLNIYIKRKQSFVLTPTLYANVNPFLSLFHLNTYPHRYIDVETKYSRDMSTQI